MMMTDPNDKMLDDLFAQARAVAPAPSDALIARVLADAVLPVQASAPIKAGGFWSGLMDTLGGWPAVGGLATATVAGIWVGIAPPASVADLTAHLIGDKVSVSLLSSDILLDTEAFPDG